MSKRKWTDQQFIEAVSSSMSYAEVLEKIGLKPAGSNYDTVKRKISELNLDISHMTGQAWNQGIRYRPVKPPQTLSEILIENSSYTSTSSLKKRLLKEGFKKNVCEQCGKSEWMGQPIPLELHHINGIKNDLRIENLQILCPNCHSKTDNFRGRNMNKKSTSPTRIIERRYLTEEEIEQRHQDKLKRRRISNSERKIYPLKEKECIVCGKTFKPKGKSTTFCSIDCYNKYRTSSSNRPSIIQLLLDFKELKSFLQVGKKYGVSDNAVVKWCKFYMIPYKKKELHKFIKELKNKL